MIFLKRGGDGALDDVLVGADANIADQEVVSVAVFLAIGRGFYNDA